MHQLHRMFSLLGVMVGGAAGWMVGKLFSTLVAVPLSIVGTGLGLFLARRFSRRHF